MSGRSTLIAAALVAASSVHAQTPGFLRTQIPNSNTCIYWQNRTFVFQADQAGYSHIPTANLFYAYDAAFQTWQALSNTCSDFTFQRGPPVLNPTVGYNPNGPNQNVLIFREKNCKTYVPPTDTCWNDDSCANVWNCWNHDDSILALTTSTFSLSSGVIVDADVEFNASPNPDEYNIANLFTVVNSPPCPAQGQPNESCVSIDVQNTLTHEIGHVIGLAHYNSWSGSTMYYLAPAGETSKRTIDPGTAKGFCDIYPRGGLSTSDCSLGQTGSTSQAAKGSSGLGCTTAGGSGASFAALAALLGLMLRARK